jgi:hypothetical protein
MIGYLTTGHKGGSPFFEGPKYRPNRNHQMNRRGSSGRTPFGLRPLFVPPLLQRLILIDASSHLGCRAAGSWGSTHHFMKFTPMPRLDCRNSGDLMRKPSEFGLKAATMIFLVGCAAIFTVIVVGGTVGGRLEDHRDRVSFTERK